ncbi:hypothetical protein BDZ89DRAFT_89254 [Hymenopellis radicata]|nr:hypothetical protein BDZ89DRAFT_89254 [Hymenopellis radicata]
MYGSASLKSRNVWCPGPSLADTCTRIGAGLSAPTSQNPFGFLRASRSSASDTFHADDNGLIFALESSFDTFGRLILQPPSTAAVIFILVTTGVVMSGSTATSKAPRCLAGYCYRCRLWTEGRLTGVLLLV